MEIEEKIKTEILKYKKDMRLDTFISNALFKKDGYYYNKEPIGKKYDFITAPEISQMFGEIIGQYLYYMWKTKIDTEFNFVELGPGNGTLFKDMYNSVSKYPNFIKKAKIKFIEINKTLTKIQKFNLSTFNLKNLVWHEKFNFRSKFPSIIYSNEFFDCFPVRQFIYKNNWYEKYVSFNNDNDNFYIKDKLITNRELISYLNLYKKDKVLEISFERNKYFEQICNYIKNKRGLFLTVDYGYKKNIENYTLQAIQNHKFSNILENIGNKDISSHVNFDEFLKIAKKYKLKIDEFCTQREFLIKYGILERKRYLSQKNNSKIIEGELNKLINNNEMGKLFKFLIISNL